MEGAERLYRRLMGLVNRGRVKLVDDSGVVQKLQIDLGPTGSDGASLGLKDQVPHLVGYGDISNPPAGTHVVVICLGDGRTDAVAVASNGQAGRYLNAQPGERGIINQMTGAYILLGANVITVHAAGQNVVVEDAAEITLNASVGVQINAPWLKCSGDIIDNSGSNAVTVKQHRDDYNAHKHTGVQAGSSSTGTTDHPAT